MSPMLALLLVLHAAGLSPFLSGFCWPWGQSVGLIPDLLDTYSLGLSAVAECAGSLPEKPVACMHCDMVDSCSLHGWLRCSMCAMLFFQLGVRKHGSSCLAW